MADFELERFTEAQAGIYVQVLAELRRGRKASHWMWFVFPQIAGLGRSPMAQHYAIGSKEEARAYLDHPLLGQRLRECTEAVLRHKEKRAVSIFGSVDAMKFRSSMTLFEAVAEDPAPFAAALETFYGGERDPETLRLIG
jgi:uncharacterized protein (DUF1810 family)